MAGVGTAFASRRSLRPLAVRAGSAGWGRVGHRKNELGADAFGNHACCRCGLLQFE